MSHLDANDLSAVATSSRIMLRSVIGVTRSIVTPLRETDSWLKIKAHTRNTYQSA